MTPPHDLAAESHVLGAMLLSPVALEAAIDQCVTEDFYSHSFSAVFTAMVTMFNRGDAINVTTVADELRRSGSSVEPHILMACQAGVPATSAIGSYCKIVVAHAARRQIVRIAQEGALKATELCDPDMLADQMRADLASVDMPVEKTPVDLHTLDGYRSYDHSEAEWLVPGLIRRQQRAMLVGDEGAGKSLITQQVAMAASVGLHPFRLDEIIPLRVLVVDLENDAFRITDGSGLIAQALNRDSFPNVMLWTRPQGVNLRRRADRAEFNAVLRKARPELVCLGPMYKCYEATAAEPYELVAREVQQVLDDLRVRYNFGLLMEHHAPQATGGKRDMRPYGSSLWLRWPEFGLSLTRAKERPSSLLVGRWRGDRVQSNWPDRLDRGNPGDLPWIGYWENGT